MDTRRTLDATVDAGDTRQTVRKHRLRATFSGLIAMFLFAAILLPAPAGAQSNRTPISGDAAPSTCNNGKGVGAIELVGDLEGCLIFFVDTGVCTELNGFALYEETGRELFIGEYEGEKGRFRTKYTLAGTYAQGACADFDAADYDSFFSKQLTGGCDHKIKGKQGVFKGMKGLIVFHDIIPEPGVSGASNFFYSGYLK